jgi:regulator of sirC expression with transglutaminase-like and TPR domain
MNENELKALISLLDDQDETIFAHVEAKLLSLGDDVIVTLEREWEQNLNPLVQQRIEDIIHRLQFIVLQNRLTDWLEHKQNDLLYGMWVIATFQYPDLDIDVLKEHIENLFYEAWKKGKELTEPIEKVRLLNDLLYTKYHFSTNTKNFHAPHNSMLNEVLDKKKGNPISLAVIYLLLAQRMRLPIYGVNLPKLFVLVCQAPNDTFYINTNNRGLIFSRDDIEQFLEQLKLPAKEQYFQPCTHLDIITRVLRNLEFSFVKLGDVDRTADIRELLTLVLGYDNSSFLPEDSQV